MIAQGIQRQMELREFGQESSPDSAERGEDLDQESTEFETNPLAWHNPHDAPDYYKSLVELFLERYEEASLLDKLEPLLEASTPKFKDHAMALWEQMFRDENPKVPAVVDFEVYKELTPHQRAVTAGNLDELLKTVFDWMTVQGMNPIPGQKEWVTILPDFMAEYLERVKE